MHDCSRGWHGGPAKSAPAHSAGQGRSMPGAPVRADVLGPPPPGAVGTRAGISCGACPHPATGATHPRSPDVSPFDRIVIIFNPNSTGNAPRSAEELRAELARRLPAVPVELCPTQHAGHARELAREAAGTGRPLLVSVSGVGGDT